MTEDALKTNRKKARWGLLLIGMGVLFLLDQMGVIDVGSMGQWWPAILITLGAFFMAMPSSGRQFASGVTLVLLGVWFFACTRHWFDLTYRNGWPLLVVIFGAEMVLAGLLDSGSKKEKSRA